MPTSTLVTIDSDYVKPRLAACYLRVEGDEAAFVETNTTWAVPKLLAALKEQGLSPEQVRWVIVTHVHLDHAGGAAALVAACPNATLVAHPRAARHLIDPSRLVASAKAVYGEEAFTALYGTIDPIPAERVLVAEDGDTVELGQAPLHFLHTRGHANHHFVVHDPGRDTVFTGDTFGLVYPDLQKAGRFAFASTSPTDFDPGEARKSVDRILALGTSTACPTHFGEIDGLDMVARQLHRWIDLSESLMEESRHLDPTRAEGILTGRIEAAMEEQAREVGLQLGEAERELLALDVKLNAQGLIFAGARQAKP